MKPCETITFGNFKIQKNDSDGIWRIYKGPYWVMQYYANRIYGSTWSNGGREVREANPDLVKYVESLAALQ